MSNTFCGKEGAYFKLEEDAEDRSSNRRHSNLYAAEGILMTKDHIRPKKLKDKSYKEKD